MTTLHPELTFADILTNFEHVQSLSDDSLSKTNVDLLEVHQTEKRQAKCIWHTALDEKSLPQLFKRRSDRGLLEIAGVRVMFLKPQPDGKGVQVHPSIVRWLHHQFNVSPTFMSHIVGLQPDTFGLLGDACLSERVDEKVTSLSGFYRCSNGILARIATFVWFFHDLAAQSSIYIVYGCTKDAKDQILRLVG